MYTEEHGSEKNNYTFPFLESIIAIGFVVLNWANIIFILAISGTARNAPIIPHIPDQNISATMMINELKLSLSHIIFGSMTFPEINWGINRHAKRINGARLVSNCTKL